MNIAKINEDLERFLRGRVELTSAAPEGELDRMRYLFSVATNFLNESAAEGSLAEFTQITNNMLGESNPSSPESQIVTRAIESVKSLKIARLRSASDPEISEALGLNVWETKGEKGEATSRIIGCFKAGDTELDLSYLGLSSVPEKMFEYLPGLSKLDLSNNSLSSIKIKNLPNLRKIDLMCNLLDSCIMVNVPNLEELDVSINRIPFLDISTLSNLKILRAGMNQLESLDTSNLTRLTDLRLGNNLIQSVNVSHLSRLTFLDLTVNKLEALDVSSLNCLNTLMLSQNRINFLDVANLTDLTELYVARNALTSLDISNLHKLEIISISNNPFDQDSADFFRRAMKLGSNLRAFTSVCKSPSFSNVRLGSFLGNEIFATSVSTWLGNLQETKDFLEAQDPFLEVFTRKVLSILDLTVRDPEFREIVLSYLIEANQSCQDGALLYLNKIELAKSLYEARALTIEDAIPVFKKAFLLQQLDKYTKILVEEYEREKHHSYGEELEAYLDLQVRLKEEFNLPVVSGSINFSNHSIISPDMEERARNRLRESMNDTGAFAAYLLLEEEWRKKIEQTFSQRLDVIKEPAYQQLEELTASPSYTNPPEARSEEERENIQKALAEPIMTQMKERKEEEILLITFELLGINPKKRKLDDL